MDGHEFFKESHASGNPLPPPPRKTIINNSLDHMGDSTHVRNQKKKNSSTLHVLVNLLR